MGGFDRSKFRGTTAAALQKTQQEMDAKRPTNNYERNILEIKVGDNKFRIFPFHPDSGIDTYSVPKTVSFLTVTKDKYDDKNRKIEGEFELKRSPIFNGKVHGNLPKDLVEEYMTIAKKIAIPNFTEDSKTAEKIWNIMTYAGKGSKAVKPSDVWVVYAKKEEGKDKDGNSIWGKIGELELKKTITAQLTEKAIEFSGDALTPDIYTDPDEGICIIINKSGEGKDTEYKVSLDTTKQKIQGQMANISVPSPLTNEELEAFLKMSPLAKKFVNSFKRKDLEFQIEGLKNFDDYLKSQGYPINVFEYSEFQNVIDELLDLVPETSEEDAPAPAADESTSDSVVEPDQSESEEEIVDEMPAPVVKPKVIQKPAVRVAPQQVAAKPTVNAVKPASRPAVIESKPVAATVTNAASGNERIDRIKAMMGKNKPAGQ